MDESKCNRACTGFQSKNCGGGTLFFSLMGTGRFKLNILDQQVQNHVVQN